MTNTVSSLYVEDQRKQYSYYILSHRALPHIADGLKAGARRVLWMAKDGHKYKSASLAGATMILHPHAAPETTINTLAAPYGNNIPLLEGIGAFGTLINPGSFGASRYTSVKLSEFTKDVVMVDIDLIPMMDNYDLTTQEPRHFLPLVPIVLLNPTEGVAIGFATKILPRGLRSILDMQISYLSDRTYTSTIYPELVPINSRSYANENNKWFFRGTYEVVNKTSLKITSLPYGLLHSKVIDHLIKLIENGVIEEYKDYSSDKIDILIIYPGNINLLSKSEENIYAEIGLEIAHTENMTMIDFNGGVVNTSFSEVIKLFSDWRLRWYKLRYERLLNAVKADIQKAKDILLAIEKNVGGLARRIESKAELTEYLKEIRIINIEYIATMPVYRFTTGEKEKTKLTLKELLAKEKHYTEIIGSQDKQREIYTKELITIKNKYAR